MEIDLKDGVVVRLPHHFQREVEKRMGDRLEDQEQIAKGLIEVDGKWIEPPPDSSRKGHPAVRVKGRQGSAKIISNGGKRVDLNEYVGRGKVTIVDFCADWCGPCRMAAPYLEQLAGNPRVDLVKIDIVNWSSPVAKQYKLRAIPNIRVFDPDGRMIGNPTHDVNVIKKYVDSAG